MAIQEIASNVYVSTEYPGANVGFIAMPQGGVAIDAPALPSDARAWRQQIEGTTGKPILYVVLTDTHPDRLLCAGLLGAPIVATRAAYDHAADYTDGFWRGVVDGWARRFPEAEEDLAEVTPVLPEVLFQEHVILHKGGMPLEVEQVAGAAPGSAWVYLADRDVLFVGDTIVVETHPFLEAADDTEAWLKTLRKLRRERFSETTIVPGRGPLTEQAATKPVSDYVALVRRRVRSLHRAERPKGDTAGFVSELMPMFPFPEERRDVVQRRVKAGLDQVYEELKPPEEEETE
jgi:glyoxylase-like metal-dependent hydrolase (beta-lactamase superfamily II)